MNLTRLSVFACATLTFLVSGCEKRNLNSTPVVPESPADKTSPVADNWLGKWNGPEATFLQLNGGNGKYEVTIQNLDGPRTFEGIAVGNQIEFDRNGEKESLRATNGAETGMKWLSEKTDCLTIRDGEGYCRD